MQQHLGSERICQISCFEKSKNERNIVIIAFHVMHAYVECKMDLSTAKRFNEFASNKIKDVSKREKRRLQLSKQYCHIDKKLTKHEHF